MDEDIICDECGVKLYKDDRKRTYIKDINGKPICRKCAETIFTLTI